MLENLPKSKPYELQVWIWSALIFGIGLGMLLSAYFEASGLWMFSPYNNPNILWITIIAFLAHLWAMYTIYKRK